jgi:hypothetical protein
MLETLNAFSNYEDDWDGQGAEAPSRYVVETAKSYIRMLANQDRLVPFEISLGPDGSIGFEWACQRFTQIVEIDDSDRRYTVIDRLNKTSHTTPI